MAQPTFSIVIATYDRPAEILNCLRSIAAVDYPRERFEVVVVDDGSPADVAAAVHAAALDLDVRVLRQPNRGPGAARNAGARVARGRLVVFTDDDCRPERDWLRALERAADDDRECMLGGRTRNGAVSIYSRTSQIISDAVYRYFNDGGRGATFFASNNLALPRAAFLAIGGFDESFRPASEDRELCDRWRSSGRAMAFVPDAVVSHAHSPTFGRFVRQYVAYGRGAARYHRVIHERGTGAPGDDVRRYLRFLACFVGSVRALPAADGLRVTGLLALWQAANTVGFALEATRMRLGGARRDAVRDRQDALGTD